MLQVAFGQSKYYSDNLSENVKRGVRQKLRRGEWLNLAPLGYVNNPRIRNIEPDEIKGKIIKRAFEEYATGNHAYVSLAQFLADLGLTTKQGKPLAKVSIKKLLTNRAYLGFVKYGDEWFDGNFAPLISPQLFEDVQKMLQTRERPRRCGQSYLQEKDLVSQLHARLQTISLPERFTNWMLEEIKKWEQEEKAISGSEIEQLSDKIKTNEKRMNKLVSTYLDGDIPKDIYLKQKDAFMRSSLVLEEKKKAVLSGRNSWVEPLREWVLDTKQATFLSETADYQQIKSFVQKIGTDPSVRDKTAHFATSVPSQFVAQRRALLPPSVPLKTAEVKFCGSGGIRTPETLSGLTVFKTVAFNHSATLPKKLMNLSPV